MPDLISYPIIFSAAMICAILREIEAPGTGKTQTRRLAFKPWTEEQRDHAGQLGPDVYLDPRGNPKDWFWCYEQWQAGVKPWLWVKETILWNGENDNFYFADKGVGTGLYKRLCADPTGRKSRPSIHMRKKYSRLSLRVTDMRMERLQDISEEDAQAEGIPFDGSKYFYGHPDKPVHKMAGARNAFPDLWDYIHGPGAWDKNPEVVMTEFTPQLKNIEAIHG